MASLNHNFRLSEMDIFLRSGLDPSGKTGGGFLVFCRSGGSGNADDIPANETPLLLVGEGELNGLASQLDPVGHDEILSDAYQSLVKDSLAHILKTTSVCRLQVFNVWTENLHRRSPPQPTRLNTRSQIQNRKNDPINKPAAKDQSPKVQAEIRRTRLRTRTLNSSSVS
jgi:hypothetical protein